MGCRMWEMTVSAMIGKAMSLLVVGVGGDGDPERSKLRGLEGIKGIRGYRPVW